MTPFVKKLLIVLGVVFVFTAIAQNFLGIRVLALFALDPRVLTVATLWQVVTNVLVQPPVNLFPLVLSVVFIWLILPPFEERYGAARVFQLTLVSTLCSSAMALLFGLLLPDYAGPIAGPGPITLGAIAAYAVLLPPHAEVSFFGMLPMQSKHLLWVIVGMSLLGFLVSRQATSLASDLGAIAGGIAFVRWWMQRPPRRRTFQRKASKLRVVGRDDERPGGGWLN